VHGVCQPISSLMWTLSNSLIGRKESVWINRALGFWLLALLTRKTGNRQRPTCSRCAEDNVRCVYSSTKRKPGPVKGSQRKKAITGGTILLQTGMVPAIGRSFPADMISQKGQVGLSRSGSMILNHILFRLRLHLAGA
jgi:hypothetical protein